MRPEDYAELTRYVNSLPDDESVKLTIDNAYKTRWVWYHTILALELLMTNVLLVAILTKL